jgi:hypothetical protein
VLDAHGFGSRRGAVMMNDAAWWARVMQARTERDDLRPQRVWALRKGEHEASIDLKAVPGIGAESCSRWTGRCRKTRLFPLTRAGGTGRRDRGHAGDVRGQGVGLKWAGNRLRSSTREAFADLPSRLIEALLLKVAVFL